MTVRGCVVFVDGAVDFAEADSFDAEAASTVASISVLAVA